MFLAFSYPLCLILGYPVLWYLFYTWLRRTGKNLRPLLLTALVQAVLVGYFMIRAGDDSGFIGIRTALIGIALGAVAGWLIYLVYRNPRLPD